MPLTPELQKSLYEMTARGKPNWKIHHWLMNYCGLSFTEAADERLKALKLFQSNQYAQIEKKPKQENKNGGQEREKETVEEKSDSGLSDILKEFKKPEAEENTDHDETESMVKDLELFEEISKKHCCITCGDPELLCDCEVKTTGQIPF